MYFVLKALARTLILPPSGPLLLAILGILLVWRRRRMGWPLVVVGVASMWLLCTPIVADQLSRFAERYPPLDPAQQTHAQAIVVLGGGDKRMDAPEYRGPVADAVLISRLAYGAFLARRMSLPVLVSGSPEEGIVMKATLSREFGVEARWVEAQSHDTYENAHFSAQMLRPEGVKRIILVTSSTHLWRAAHEFMGVGFDVVPAPEGLVTDSEVREFSFVPSPSGLTRSTAALYELIGEPMRRLQAATGVRERFDKKATVGEPAARARARKSAEASHGS